MRTFFTILIFIITFLLRYVTYAQNTSYVLKGHIGYPTKGIAILRCISDQSRPTDTVAIIGGSFTFKGDVREPLTMRIFLAKSLHSYENHYTPSIRIYLEPGKIYFTSPDSIDHATVKGTVLNEDYSRLNEKFFPLEQQLVHLMEARRKASSTKESDVLLRQQLTQQLATVRLARHDAVAEFIKQHPSSLVSADLLEEYRAILFTDAEVKDLFEKLSPKVKFSKLGQRCAQYLAQVRSTAIDAFAPDFNQPDTTGQKTSLHSFQGQYVLLDFWASWCGPCRVENRNFLAIYNRYKGRNFTILNISIDDNRRAWLKAVADDKLPWTQLADLDKSDKSPTHLYAIETIPRNFLIGPNGQIIAKDLSGEELSKKLESILPDAKP